jgi:hypothetical protein
MRVKNVWKWMALGCFAVAVQAASAQDANMEKAMTAAFDSKEIKKLKVKGHEFNVKPVKSESSGGAVKVTGQISHHRTLQDDDQVHYSFTIGADGKVTNLDVNIEKSLMHKVLGLVWDEVLKEVLSGDATSGDGSGKGTAEQALTASDELKSLEEAIKLAESKIGTGGWEKSAAAIVANVMIRSKPATSARSSRVYDRVSHLRRMIKSDGYRPAPSVKTAPARTGAGRVTATGGYQPAAKIRDQRKR